MSRKRRSIRGLTLLEVVISISLIGMLLGALLTFFWQTVEIRDRAKQSAARTQLVQQILERMASELRDSVGMDKVGFDLVRQFDGDRRRITFLTTPLPPERSYAFYRESAAAPAPRHDLAEITYELWIDPDEKTDKGDPLVGGILRTERQALEPAIPEEEVPEDQDLLYVRHDLWNYEIGYLEFRYFDGVEWSTTWHVSQGNALPHLVQITIGFDSLTREQYEDRDLDAFPLAQYPLGPDHPDRNRYSTIVRLPAADEMFSARMNRVSDEVKEVYNFGGETTGDGQNKGTGGGGTKP